MPAKMLCAALVTLTVMTPAALAGGGHRNDNSSVIKLGAVDAANPQDVDRAMRAIKDAAREACKVTGSRIISTVCVEAFIGDAILAVRNRDLQVALLGGEPSGGTPQTAAAPKSE